MIAVFSSPSGAGWAVGGIFPRFLVALPPLRDLLLRAKHLFVAAMVTRRDAVGVRLFTRNGIDGSGRRVG